MKKKHKVTRATLLFVACAVTCGWMFSIFADSKSTPFLKPMTQEEVSQLRHNKLLETVSRTDYFYEDFEKGGGDDLVLPDGWVTTATPGNDTDKWLCGTLSDNGSPINGASGWQYAFVLGRPDGKEHDTWLFSPTIHLTRGTHYLDFYTYMPKSVNGETSLVEVSLCRGQSAESAITTLATCDKPVDVWTKYVRSFTAEEEGDYVIGFRCASPANTNAVLIDNVRVSDGENPQYGGYESIEVGDVDIRVGKGSAETMVWNNGNVPLKVTLKECSDEITVSGLPLEIEAFDEAAGSGFGNFTVTVNLNELKDYEGYVLLETNDPLHPEVRLSVTARGKEYSTSNYISESFESGTPVDWEITDLSFILKAYGAQDGNNSWYSTTDSSDRNPTYGGVGFTTNYVVLGSSPVVSFWYKTYYEDWRGNPTDAASADDVKFTVFLNNDDGAWEEIYTVAPDADLKHNPSLDFQKVEFSLPDHAGETRRLRLVFSKAEGGNNYTVLVDNFKAGTCPDRDIALTNFEGPSLLNVYDNATFQLTIVNQGSEPITYGGLMLKDLTTDKVLKRMECPEIKPFETYVYTFDWSPSEEGYYHLAMAATNYNDPNEDNNQSYPIHLSVLSSDNTATVIDKGDEPTKGFLYPVNFNSLESITQTIYYANELGINSGDIKSIVYTSILNEPYMSDEFELYIAETDKENFDNGTFIPEDNFTKVFEGQMYFPADTANFVVPFSQPYRYKGGNLVVMSKRKAKMFMYGVYYKCIKDSQLRTRSIEQSALSEGGVFGDNATTTPTTTIVFPPITVNISEAANGIVEGIVTDENDTPIENAKVSVSGSQLYTYTDADGHYLLNKVAAGDVRLDVTAKGYYPLTTPLTTINASKSNTINVSLNAYTRVSLTGKVTDRENHDGIESVCVIVDGYESFRTYTDAEGNYKINGIAADTGQDYTVRFENPFFKIATATTTINTSATQNMELVVKPSHPNKVMVTTDEESSSNISWKEPLAEYSYDSGTPSDFVGWNGGHAGVIAGAKFEKKTEIEEVSWYCSSTASGHDHFNVIIFGLFPDGSVNPNNILYYAEDVEYVDNAWSTHRLSRKITADGYLVAISCDGFLSIGICEPTEETPFEVGQNYYAGIDYKYSISEMSEWKPAHFMIRAYGNDLGEWSGLNVESQPLPESFAGKPAPSYNVYRFTPTTPREEWTKIATVSETSYIDQDFITLENGKYHYAVTSNYGNTESIENICYAIDKTTDGIVEVSSEQLEISLRGDALVLSKPELVENISIYNISGSLLSSINRPSGSVDLNDIPSGIIIIRVKDINGNNSCFKVIR